MNVFKHLCYFFVTKDVSRTLPATMKSSLFHFAKCNPSIPVRPLQSNIKKYTSQCLVSTSGRWFTACHPDHETPPVSQFSAFVPGANFGNPAKPRETRRRRTSIRDPGSTTTLPREPKTAQPPPEPGRNLRGSTAAERNGTETLPPSPPRTRKRTERTQIGIYFKKLAPLFTTLSSQFSNSIQLLSNGTVPIGITKGTGYFFAPPPPGLFLLGRIIINSFVETFPRPAARGKGRGGARGATYQELKRVRNLLYGIYTGATSRTTTAARPGYVPVVNYVILLRHLCRVFVNSPYAQLARAPNSCSLER